MARMIRDMAAVGLAVGLAACGAADEPVEIDADEGVGEVGGEIHGDLNQNLVDPHVGVIWAKWNEQTMQEQLQTQVTSVDATRLPARFNLSNLTPPDAGLLEEWVDYDGSVSRIGFGYVVAFDDVNGDDAFSVNELGIDAPDLLFGLATEHVLLYVDRITPDTAQAMFGVSSLSPGFHILTMDLCAVWETGLYFEVTDGAAVAIETFPAAATPPEEMHRNENECPNAPEDPYEECDEACLACLEEVSRACDAACVEERTAVETCANESGCFDEATGGDADLCFKSACGEELQAMDACYAAACNSGYEACFSS